MHLRYWNRVCNERRKSPLPTEKDKDNDMKNLLKLTVLSLAIMLVSPLYALADKGSADQCGSDCASCASMCEKTLKYFESKGGKYAEAANINLLKDCIAACKLNAELKSRSSSLVARSSALCAEACNRCAVMCESMEDSNLKDCVASCKSCAVHCKAGAGSDGKTAAACCPDAAKAPAESPQEGK